MKPKLLLVDDEEGIRKSSVLRWKTAATPFDR